MRKSVYFFVLIVIFLLALLIPDKNILSIPTPQNYFSWFLAGVWGIYSLNFMNNMKQASDYGSPYNSAYFIMGSMGIAILYTVWGNYTTILNQTVSQPLDPNLYLNLWILIFATPFFLFSHITLFNSFRKYYSVYLRRTPVDSRRFGFVICIFDLIIIIIALYDPLLIFGVIDENLHPNLHLPNLYLWISLFLHICIFIYGIVRPRARVSSLNAAALSNRIGSIDNRIHNADRVSQSAQERERQEQQRRTTQQRERERRNEQNREAERRERERRDRERREEERNKTEIRRQNPPVRASVSSAPSQLSATQLDQMRPKGGSLSEDDFKCIFCFKLPKLPEDKNRDIVLCPNCHYPAHYEEYMGWMRNSKFCSRCSAEIPGRLRSNPTRIKSSVYVQAIKQILKK